MTAPITAPITGQDLGVAAAATRRLFDNLLADAGSDFEEWVTLLTLSQRPEAIERAALRTTLGQLLSIAEPTADRLISRTAARGYVSAGDGVSVTAQGEQTLQQLRTSTGELTATLYRDFAPADLETAGRVIREVAQRAKALAS
jgi:DNA-binding MarR family transcriptional regulator